MKNGKFGLVIGLLLVLLFLTWFLYPRLFLPKYIIEGNTMTYKDIVYVGNMYAGQDEIYGRGKIIGTAIRKDSKNKVGDFIFVEWVKQYSDKNSICIRTFMGPVEVYDKVSKS